MPEISWTDDLLVGVPEVDEQHHRLIDLTARLYRAFLEDRDRELLSDMVMDLDDYVRTHFRTEEALMDRIGYADAQAHRDEHRQFTSQVLDFLLGFVQDRKSLTEEILDCLVDWWLTHIRGADKALALALRIAAGVEAAP